MPPFRLLPEKLTGNTFAGSLFFEILEFPFFSEHFQESISSGIFSLVLELH